jgi:hypothetical protein
MINRQNYFYKAAVQHFAAAKSEAIAVLDMYCNNNTAIGDHPDILTEIVKQTKALAEAEECLVILEDYADDI